MRFSEFAVQTFVDLKNFLTRRENRIPAFLFILYFLGMGIYSVIRMSNPDNPTDFGNHFYTAARDILYRGESMFGKYNYNAYPSLFYCIIAPFALFTRPVAASLWYLFTFGLFILTAAMAIELIKRELDIGKAAVILPLVLLSVVLSDNLYLGQSNFLPLFFITLSLFLDSENKEIPAGIALGLAIALKITPGIFVLYFLINRRWRLVLSSGLSFLFFIFLAPGLFFGFKENISLSIEWLKRVIVPFFTSGKNGTETVTYYFLNQSPEAILHRYFTPYGREVYGGLFTLLNWSLPSDLINAILKIWRFLVAGLLIIIHLLYREKKTLTASFYFYAILLISPASWTNHYLLLTIPYFTFINYVRFEWKGWQKTLAIIALSFGIGITAFSVTPYLQALGMLFLGNLVLFTAIFFSLTLDKATSALKKNKTL